MRCVMAQYFSLLNKFFIMADDKNLRGGQDRSRVSADEEYEIRHLAEKHGVSAEDVRKAIQKVGNSRQKVEEELKSGRNRR